MNLIIETLFSEEKFVSNSAFALKIGHYFLRRKEPDPAILFLFSQGWLCNKILILSAIFWFRLCSEI